MARVYLAHHNGIGLDVAFKVLHPEHADDPTFVKRLAREAQAIARLDHPNIIGVLDFGQAQLPDDGGTMCYLAMEYVNGRPLDTELERVGAMPAERAAHILSQIVAGVAGAHERGIVHRDLKPSNIMLRQRGSDQDFVTILDFGLSRTVEPDPAMPQLTGTAQIVGTPHYMAPECWGSSNVDPRSDLYAIGVIAYELLTGTLPFSGPVASILFQAVHEQPPRPSDVVADVPTALETIVMRCMAKSPDDRYPNAEALLAALGEAWRTLPRRTGRRTTYAATSAAPPPPRADELPDPTIWQSKQMDALRDGPAVVSEIGRLLVLRRRHLGELATATWPTGAPERVTTLRADIERLEQEIDEHGQQVALLEARIDDFDRDVREQEAELRGQMVIASVELTMPRGLWSGDTDGFDRREVLGMRATEMPGPPDERLRYAERSLASLHRSQLKEQLALRDILTEHIGALRRLEAQLDVLYEELGKVLDGAVPRGSALQPQLVAFQKLDGAIAAYKALLASFD